MAELYFFRNGKYQCPDRVKILMSFSLSVLALPCGTLQRCPVVIRDRRLLNECIA
jgi:hypothetical protein